MTYNQRRVQSQSYGTCVHTACLL